MFTCIVFVLFLALSQTAVHAQFQCRTPLGISGQCVSLQSCPDLLARFQGPMTAAVTSYLRSLQCESNVGQYPHVCCAVPDSSQSQRPTLLTPVSSFNRISSGAGNALPSTCPVTSTEHILGDRIIGGFDAQLDDYPWTVLLEYRNRLQPQNKKLSCGGSLISTRYVLTAAHCLVGEIERKVGRLVGVRLGEYDITSAVDCIEDKCSDPVVYMGVEEIIPHPRYTESDKHRKNDIGLVRMDGDVAYTNYIMPICLPTAVYSSPSVQNEILASAGWGRTLTRRQSAIKQKIYLPLYDQAQCIEQYRAIGINVDETQLCAGGIDEQDTCDGDSGNALMKIASNSWVVEGVVSFGRSCGQPDRPAVYTRVSAFDQWIRSNMRP